GRIVAGDLLGAAMAERTEETGNSVRLRPEGEGWRLDGEKYYCTGAIYADWIVTAAVGEGEEGEEFVSVAVPGNAPGVERSDDWDGFGQRLTGSGSTRFAGVAVAPEQVIHRGRRGGFQER